MATHMRLRLVVRRNGLPDTNVVWPVPLENNPTVAKLLEQVNDILPLESGEWGLEDYAVELQSSDGSSFECLHFQPLRSVLKEDDQVFIRPLFTDDLRRRRVSGRHQISTDGKHLIDGIAFGRPLLKTPRGRPGLEIPPRKRRRIILDGETSDDSEEHEDGDSEYEDEEGDAPMLLLTNGEEADGDSRSVRIAAEFDDVDPEIEHQASPNEDQDEDSESEDVVRDMDQDSESDEDDDDMELDFEDPEDLEQELKDLREERESHRATDDKQQRLLERKGSSPPLAQNQETNEDDEEHEDEQQLQAASSPQARPLSLEGLDKIGALRAAFPSAPAQVCQEILTAEEGDMKKCYLTLLQGFESNMSESELLKLWRQKQGNKANSSTAPTPNLDHKKPSTSNHPLAATSQTNDIEDEEEEEEEEEDDNDEDDVPSFVRRFDYRGLPPGSISSGNALKAMADISASFTGNKSGGEGKTTSATLVRNKQSLDTPDKTNDLDDETSSSGTSSSSEDEGEIQQGEHSEDSSSSDSENDAPGASGNPKGHSADSDASTSDSDSDSAPEEESTKRGASLSTSGFSKKASRAVSDVDKSDLSSSSSEDSDADDETSSSGESSDEESSEGESSSESESEKRPAPSKKPQQSAQQSGPKSLPMRSVPTIESQSPSTSTQATVPPGAGKLATKMRNSRRRTKKNASKLEQVQTPDVTLLGTPDAASTSVSTEKQRNKELFEAKRQALLDAIADGGVEVGPGGHFAMDQSTISQNSNKRKRGEAETPKGAEQTPKETEAAVSQETESPTTAEKRRRLDMGAGRRMLFGALGLRNPKTREDEDKLRTKLMKDVRPLQNARLIEEKTKATTPGSQEADTANVQEPIVEDPDAWRAKITYRAVECCHEGVELSEPPFPFVQRWDPQQQVSWGQKKNKRGGRGKKAERNQAHFYQDDGHSATQRKHNASQDWDEQNHYDDTFDAVEETHDEDIQLNYDDVEPEKDVVNEPNHLTDLDDLPSLPQDLTSLSNLRPGEVQEGMVITWKQFVLSKATNWQPQVCDITGVVCNIYDDVTGFKVMLAKRDRHLDRTEKEYDNNTGQRIYGRFEAPDDEEEDEEDAEEDAGYRTVSFDSMMEPRVLQPAIPIEKLNGEVNMPSVEQDTTMPEAGVTTEREGGMSDEQPIAMELTSENPATTDAHAGTKDVVETTESSEGPVTGTTNNSTESQPAQGQQSRNVSMSDLSQISSPSRQLHKESMNVLINASHNKEKTPETPAGNITSTAGVTAHEPIASDPVQDQETSSVPIPNGDVITGTPNGTYPKLPVPPSSASSVRSGRQPDFSMDLDIAEPDSFRTTTQDSIEIENHDNIDGSVLLGEQSMFVHGEDEKTPVPTTPKPRSSVLDSQQQLEDGAKANDGPTYEDGGNARGSSPAAASTPCSLTSLNTVWCTAATSRNTHSPTKSQVHSAMKSHKSQGLKESDAEYEDAMRKLDDLDDIEISQDVSKISDSFKPGADESDLKAQSLSPLADGADNDRDMDGSPGADDRSSLPPRARTEAKISPPPMSRGRGRPRISRVTSSPMVGKAASPARRTRRSIQASQSNVPIPPGSQVFEISSDSDEPSYVENYADDSVDQSYSPVSLPKGGAGRVKKETRNARSSTAPLGAQKGRVAANRTVSASQGASSSQPRGMQQSAAAVLRRMGKGRKASAKF